MSPEDARAFEKFVELGTPRGWFLNRALDGVWGVVIVRQLPTFIGGGPQRLTLEVIGTGPTLELAVADAIASTPPETPSRGPGYKRGDTAGELAS